MEAEASPVKRTKAIKYPCSNLASLLQGRINPRYHPVLSLNRKTEYPPALPPLSYTKSPYFRNGNRGESASRYHPTLYSGFLSVTRTDAFHLLGSIKELSGDIQSRNAPACTIRRLSLPWTAHDLVLILAFKDACNAGRVKSYSLHFRNSRVRKTSLSCRLAPCAGSLQRICDAYSRSLLFVLSLIVLIINT